MHKRIVLAFDLSEEDAITPEQVEEYARRLNDDAAYLIGYEGWRVEDGS